MSPPSDVPARPLLPTGAHPPGFGMTLAAEVLAGLPEDPWLEVRTHAVAAVALRACEVTRVGGPAVERWLIAEALASHLVPFCRAMARPAAGWRRGGGGSGPRLFGACCHPRLPRAGFLALAAAEFLELPPDAALAVATDVSRLARRWGQPGVCDAR